MNSSYFGSVLKGFPDRICCVALDSRSINLVSSVGCNYFSEGSCRSCDLIQLPYTEQLVRKEQSLAAQLARFEHTEFLPIVPSPRDFGSRNKAKMIVGGFAHAPILGVATEDLTVRELARCPLHHPDIRKVLEWLPSGIARAGIAPYQTARKRGELKGVIVRRSSSNGALVVRFVARSTESRARFQLLADSLRLEFEAVEIVTLNVQPIPHAILEGPEEMTLSGGRWLEETLNGIPLLFPARSFSQVNSEVAAALYHRAAELVALAKPRTAWDLYCGVGAFSLTASANTSCRFTGVEVVEDAIEAARETANRLQRADLAFMTDPVEEFLGRPQVSPDLIIANPPRAGLDRVVIARILELRPATLLYSSCNPETLVRDLTNITPNYRSIKVQPFDMFPHTSHMEVLAQISDPN